MLGEAILLSSERDYMYSVDPINVADGKLNIRFTIRETREAFAPVPGIESTELSDSVRLEHSRQMYEAIRERDEAEVQVRSARQKFEVGLLPAPELESATLRSRHAAQRVEDLFRLTGGSGQQRGRSGGQNIIDSTFAISLGETVVVGTSRLNGDRALIAILTAAAKPTGAAR